MWDGVYRGIYEVSTTPMAQVGDRQTLISSAGITTLVVTTVSEDGEVTARPATADELR